MPKKIIYGGETSQPKGLARPNSGFQFRSSLTYLGRGGLHLRNLVSNALPTIIAGSPVLGFGSVGSAFQSTTTADVLSLGAVDQFVGTTGSTIVVVMERLTTEANRFGCLEDAIATRCSAHIPFSDGTTYFDYGGTSGANRISVAGLSYVGPQNFVFSAGARGSEIIQNGIVRASQGSAITRTTTAESFYIGSPSSGSNQVRVYMLALFNTQLPAAACRELSANPWQLFAPAPIRALYFLPSAAGVTVSVVARAGRLRGAATVAASRTVAVVARAAKLRAADAVAPSRAVALTARAAKLRAADTIAASRAVALVARARVAHGASTYAGARSIAISARAGRARSALTDTTARSVAVVARAGRLRSANSGSQTTAVIVNLTARAGRLRAALAVAPSRGVTLYARAGRARASVALATGRAAALVARAGRLRAGDTVAPLRLVSIAVRAGRVRAAIAAAPPATFDYIDPRYTVQHKPSNAIAHRASRTVRNPR